MNAKAKSNSVITTSVTEDQMVITFNVKDAGVITLDLGKVNPAILVRARTHGFIQKVADRAAIPFDKETGKYATPQQKMVAMQELVDHFISGSAEWSPKRAEGSGRKPGGLDPIILAAVAEATGKTIADVRELVKKGAEAKSTTQAVYLTALGGAAKVKVIVDRMREEQAKSIDLDGDDLLEGLGE